MKKIVALVLSLVMALSLCTVAFAVADGDVFYADQTATAGGVTYTYHAASTYKATGSDTNDVAWFGGSDGTFYLVGDATGTKIWKNGTTVADVTLGDEIEVGEASYVYTAEAVKASDWSCSTDKYDAGYKYVSVDGNTYYAEDAQKGDAGAWKALVNGEIIWVVDQDPATGISGQHVLAVPAAGKKEVGVGVYEAYCCACKKTVKISDMMISDAGYLYDDSINIKVLQDAGITIAVPSGYELLTGPWYVVDAAASTTPAEGVNSAKTFDAGVAMYVGMSLLSVAGGAVVIGKKKEF